MSNIRKPIIISSSLQFIVVGPALGGFGSLIQSENASTELIGLANKIHSAKNSHHLGNNMKEMIIKMDIRYLQTDVKYGDFGNPRSVKIMMFWVDEASSSMLKNNLPFGEVHNSPLYHTFIDFLSNSHNQLNTMTSNPLTTHQYETYTTQITWNISPLILECMNPEEFL